MTNNLTFATSDPAAWWRIVGFPLPNLAISGDLDISSDESIVAQLTEWQELGITDIVDARGECTDEDLVAEFAPSLEYHWVGTHDNGGTQSLDWFDYGVASILMALDDPNRKVIVHCHMGVNRGPSLAFAAMLTMGYEPLETLEAIRAQRPIAAVLYAPDALAWWHHRFGSKYPHRTLDADLAEVETWMQENPVDLDWIISRIREVEEVA